MINPRINPGADARGAAIGILDITGHKSHPDATDIALLTVSAVIAIAIGVGLGAMTRLERRGGHRGRSSRSGACGCGPG